MLGHQKVLLSTPDSEGTADHPAEPSKPDIFELGTGSVFGYFFGSLPIILENSIPILDIYNTLMATLSPLFMSCASCVIFKPHERMPSSVIYCNRSVSN